VSLVPFEMSIFRDQFAIAPDLIVETHRMPESELWADPVSASLMSTSSIAQFSATSSGRSDSEPPADCALIAESVAATASAERAKALVHDNLRFIWRLLRRLGLDASDADDGTQRVFFTAIQRIDDIRPGSERAFLYRTAVRTAFKIHAAAGRRNDTERTILEHVADPAPTPEDVADRRRARELLDHVLDTMSLELRSVFVLFEIECMTTAQIADMLGVPLGTVASRLRRARADFEERIQRLEARMKFRRGER
jgi:RNA polymerase sigma-70 factor (ECF subfamily)